MTRWEGPTPQAPCRPPKPSDEELRCWAEGYPYDPTGLTCWARREWDRLDDVRRVRAAGERQAEEMRMVTPARRRRIDWGALHCAFWCLVLAAFMAVLIAAVVSQ